MKRARIAFPVLTLFLALVAGVAIRAFSRPRAQARALDPAPTAVHRSGDLPVRALAQPETAPLEDEEVRPTVLVPQYHPRPAGEWQGMLVDVAHPQYCEQTEQCGLALSCRGSRCLPCRTTSDCLAGEDCVMDHCLKQELVQCRRTSDCGSSRACILSGYSGGPRTNETTRAYCVDTTSGEAQSVEHWQARQPKADPEPPDTPPRPPTTEEDLLQRLQ